MRSTVLLAAAALAAGFRAPQQAVDTPQAPRDGTDAGTPPVEAAELDDSVPLPVARLAATGDGGDVVVAEASGDPHFLGFVAGRHYPPPDERIDPELLASVRAAYDDGRPDSSTYAFVMFSRRITPARSAQLEALGCRVLGFHPHYTLGVALPATSLETVADLDFVRWIGVPKAWQKVHPRMELELERLAPGRTIDVWVSVHESDLGPDSTWRAVGTVHATDPGHADEEPGADASRGRVWMSNGWQQRVLEAQGAEVVEYVDRIRAFRARVPPEALESLVALDFVQFVEPDLADDDDHDEATPQSLSDYSRSAYDGGTNSVAIAGELDSGLDTSHFMLNHFFAVGWNYGDGASAFDDPCDHGSHVAGTILGLPQAGFEGVTGNAPGLGASASLRFRFVRKSNDDCTGTGTSHATMYSNMRGDYVDGSGNVSPKPHVINNSWSSNAAIGSPFFGTESASRTLDAEVWDHAQLYVFSSSNEGSSVGDRSVGSPSVAKNAFTVGSVLDYAEAGVGDPGVRALSSSYGPCGDDRWKPNITAPGRRLRSADANTTTDYKDLSGTSMSAPMVTGIAAQLCDHYSFFRYAPHRLASVLMATAQPYQDEVLMTPSSSPSSHLNRYGAGRINAARAHYGWGDDSDWTNWNVTLASGTSTHADFSVPAGATRLVVVMTYHEDQCSAGASQALVNDLDLWLDSPSGGIDPANNTGEYFLHQSQVDNTEIRYLSNPASGTWRWKVWPDSTTSSSRVSVTVLTLETDTTPDGSLTVTADDVYVQPGDDVEITAAVWNPEYFASAVFLDSSSSGDTLQAATTTLDDGLVTDLTDNQHSGRDIEVGTIRPGDTRSAVWTTRWATEGVKSWCVEARSDNWVDESDCVDVTVDGTAPGLPTNLHSTTHALNVWSNDPTITWAWTAATDNLSGIDGYGVFVSSGPGLPSATKDIEGVTSYADTLTEGTRHLNLRPVDNCGNWHAAYASDGPYRIDLTDPGAVTNLASATHPVGAHSCNTSVTVTWTAATDALSGLGGYAALWDASPATVLDMAPNLGAGLTQHAQNIGSSAFARYFHIAAVDVAGNVGTTVHYGPIWVNAASVVTYCAGKLNSLGCTPAVGSVGQPSKSAGTFTVTGSNVINNKLGILFWGSSPANTPFQGGIKCVANPTLRTPTQSSGGSPAGNDCSGTYSFDFSTAYMTSVGIDPGDTIHAQWWMRDPASPSTTGLSNAVRFTVCE